jgi:hypothetical protein
MSTETDALADAIRWVDEPFLYAVLVALLLVFAEAAVVTAGSNLRRHGRPWHLAPATTARGRLDWAITWVFAGIVAVAAFGIWRHGTHRVPHPGLAGVLVYANLALAVLAMRRAWHVARPRREARGNGKTNGGDDHESR